MGVKVLVEDLRGLLAEVSPLPPGVEESGPQDHDRLAGALLQLDLRALDFEHHSKKPINVGHVGLN